jgi:hypothetical protein
MQRVLSRPVSGFVWLTGVSRSVGHLEGREGATYLGGQTSAMWLLSTPLYTGARFGRPYVDTVYSAFFERVDPFFEGFFPCRPYSTNHPSRSYTPHTSRPATQAHTQGLTKK